MRPGRLTIPLRRNGNAPMQLQLIGIADDGVTEIPVNLTDATLKLQVRAYPGAPGDPLLTLTSAVEIVIDNAAGGIVIIDWSTLLAALGQFPTTAEAGDPARPRIDTFAYDLVRIDPAGARQVIVEGAIELSFGVTRA